MHKLAQTVLDTLVPDPAAQAEWTSPRPLSPVSQSEAMSEAVSRIQEAKQNGEKVMVCGDYDADGMLSTAILVDALRRYGLETGFYIPDRIKEGYGLSAGTVSAAKAKGYGLLITVDNGIKAFDAIEKAHELDIDLMVTDHHHMEEEPDVDWLVHPDLLEPDFSTLCGAGIAYELVRALGLDTGFSLQLAGVASIADRMQVTGQTRSIIQAALDSMNRRRDLHLLALCADPAITEVHVGFQIAPKLNAVGRLADRANANNVVKWLLNPGLSVIRDFAAQIEGLNNTRKELSKSVSDAARKQVDVSDSILFVCGQGFHEGVVGLAAGNLCQETGKPAIVGTVCEEGIKCSMRAPAGFDCMEALSGFPSFLAFGGHAAAAGFTLPLEAVGDFRSYLKTVDTDFEAPSVPSISVSEDWLDLESVRELDRLRPFGPGFEMPLLKLENPAVKSVYDLSGGLHRRYTLNGGLQCMRFGQPVSERSASGPVASFAGSVQVKTWNGRTSCQFIVDQVEFD